MKWSHFIEYIRGQGFSGDGDDFAAVQKWLRENGQDPDTVTSDGSVVELKSLFDDRPGKPLDVSAAAAEAKTQAEIDRRVRAAVEDLGPSQLAVGLGVGLDDDQVASLVDGDETRAGGGE